MTNGNQLNQSINPSNFTKAWFFVSRLTIQLKQRPIITAKPWDSDFPSRQIAPSFDTLGSVLSPLFALNAKSRLLKIAQYLCFYWKTESKPYVTNIRDASFKVNVNVRRRSLRKSRPNVVEKSLIRGAVEILLGDTADFYVSMRNVKMQKHTEHETRE